jgi:hypothetical protein
MVIFSRICSLLDYSGLYLLAFTHLPADSNVEAYLGVCIHSLFLDFGHAQCRVQTTVTCSLLAEILANDTEIPEPSLHKFISKVCVWKVI